METRPMRLAVVIAGAALVCSMVGTGSALAQSEATTIYACASKITALLRLVSGPDQCNGLENPIQWNASGPPGPTGPAGTSLARTVFRTPADGPGVLPELDQPARVVASLAVTVGTRWAITATVRLRNRRARAPLRAECGLAVGTTIGVDDEHVALYPPNDADGVTFTELTLHGATIVLPGPDPNNPVVNFINVSCRGDGFTFWTKARITAVQVTEVESVSSVSN